MSDKESDGFLHFVGFLLGVGFFVGFVFLLLWRWNYTGFIIGFGGFFVAIAVVFVFLGVSGGDRIQPKTECNKTNSLEIKHKEPSFTENKVLRELNIIGIYPKTQYRISNMHVDFAFPDKKIAIEIDGPHHRTEEVRRKDGNRDDFLQSSGWKVRRYTEAEVDESPRKVAEKIRYFLNRN